MKKIALRKNIICTDSCSSQIFVNFLPFLSSANISTIVSNQTSYRPLSTNMYLVLLLFIFFKYSYHSNIKWGWNHEVYVVRQEFPVLLGVCWRAFSSAKKPEMFLFPTSPALPTKGDSCCAVTAVPRASFLSLYLCCIPPARYTTHTEHNI